MKRAATEQVREDEDDEDEDDGDVNPNTEHRTTASYGRLPTTMTIGIPTSGKAGKTEIPLGEEMAAIKQEIDNANACLQYALSKDRTSLRSTFEQLQGSSPTLGSIFRPKEKFPIICEKLTRFIQNQQKCYDEIEQFLIQIEKHLRATIQPDC